MTDATPPQAEPQGFLTRLATFVIRHRGRVVIGWIVLLIAVFAITPSLTGDYEADYGTPNSESDNAQKLIQDRFPGNSDETVDVVYKSDAGAESPAAKERVDAFVKDAQKEEGIGDASPPQVSPDGKIAIVRLALDRPGWDVPVETGENLIDDAEKANGEGVQLELGGSVIQEAQEGGDPAGVGFLAAAIVLLIAFGSVVAAGLPLATAAFGIAISTALIGVLAAVVDVPDWTTAVASLIGIGVGIDYSLLILTRFRTEMHEGREPNAAIVEAVRTAGRSALIAGVIVLIAVLGLCVMGVTYLYGVAFATSISVLLVMAASLTLLPALLAFAGRRVDRLKIPGLGRALKTGGEPVRARKWSQGVQKRPWTAAIVGTAVLLLLAAPLFGIRLGFPDSGNDRDGTTTRTAFQLTEEGFGPGASGPLLLVGDLKSPQDRQGLDRVAAAARADKDVAFVAPPRVNKDGDAGIVLVSPRSSPDAPETVELVNRLREDTIPSSAGGTEVLVGGVTASLEDQSELVASRLPLFIVGVVGLSFLLLLFAFRAPLVSLKAALMNLLSVGAAYGVIALFAEGGFFGQLIGIDTEVPIAPFIPVMMFAILFGLSMDYEVFLLSRVREEFLKIGETHQAVTEGLAKTARVITAAAAIMIVVFMGFLASEEVFLKLMGLGMATAILVDATIVRMVLVPAVMQLLGRMNWWIPGWLDRLLPHLDPEAEPSSRPAPAPAAGGS